MTDTKILKELLNVIRRYTREITRDLKDHIFYSAYNPINDAAYVFDQTGRTDMNAGWIDTERWDVVKFSVMITTLASTSILLLIQGDVAGQLTDYYSETFIAATTRPKLVVIYNPPKRIRVGLMVTVNGTDSVTVACEITKIGK